jgi:predicted oxidoreductase
MQPITGTTNPQRLKESFAAADITLSREEWYQIYKAAGNILP